MQLHKDLARALLSGTLSDEYPGTGMEIGEIGYDM